MYSYADRLRAVELYIRLGKRLKATIRQLGYPTKNALRGWYREYVENRDLRAQAVARAPKFSEVQKQAALEHYRTHDRCISSTMRALGYPGRGTLTGWVREAFPEARSSMVGRSWRRGYSDEIRQAGAIGFCRGDESAQQVADRLGVSRPTLYSWKDQLLGHEASSSMKRRKTNAKAPEREELERKLEALQRDVRQLQLEHDLLKKANELLKKGLGGDLQILSNREKTQLVDALRNIYRVPELLAQLDLARSSYFYHRIRVGLADKYVAIRRSMTEIFETNHRCYGYRRLHASLARQSVTISEKVVQRLMKQEQLVVARPRRKRFGSYGRNQPGAREHNQSGLSCECAEREVADRHHRVPDPSWEGLPFAYHRLLRRHGHQLVDWNATRCRAGQHHAGCRHCDRDRIGRAANRSFRSRSSLSLARLANPDQRSETGSLDVPKGLLARQFRVRRLLRPVENRTLLSSGLEGHDHRTVRRRGGCLYLLVQ